eukprot:scaffold1305_cov144-Skeletonema_menzelii.AAC.6
MQRRGSVFYFLIDKYLGTITIRFVASKMSGVRTRVKYMIQSVPESREESLQSQPTFASEPITSSEGGVLLL